jgi:glycosyltransferase involved in cell wall biosynthesis
MPMKKIAFIVPSLDGSEITRAYPFAKLLQENHDVKIYGKNPTGKLYIEDEIEVTIPETNTISQVVYLVRTLEKYDIICISKPRFYSTLAGIILKLKGKRLVVDLDDDELAMIQFNQDPNTVISRIKNITKHLVTMFNFQILRLADIVIVASTNLQKKYGGRIVPVPVDTSFFDHKINSESIRKKYKCQYLIVYTGAVRRYKGIDTLIRSYTMIENNFPDTKLLIVGPLFHDSKYYKEITTLARSISGNIIFTDFVDYKSIPQYMASADVLIISNPNNIIHKSQCPIKLMEYMAMKKPIISTDVGDACEILDNGDCGLIVNPDLPREISNTVLEIFNNKKLSEEIADNALDKCNRVYSFNSNREKIEKYYCG